MKLDERHLAQLAAVVDAGSVKDGAALIGVSQPALSRTLALLEKRVGEPLFVSGRRPLQPTAVGRELAGHGRAILAASRKASQTAANVRSGRQGRVRLAGAPFFLDAIVSGIVAAFQVTEPQIHIAQYYGYYNELLAQLVANEIDVAVTPAGAREIGPDLAFEPLIAARNVVACSTLHPLFVKEAPTREDFLRSAWVAPLPGSPLMLDLTNILMTLGIDELAIRYSGGSLLSVVNYLAAGQALAILPLSVVYALPSELRIVALPLDIPQPERVIGVAYRRHSEIDPVNRKFIGYLCSNLKNFARVVARRDAATEWRRGPFMRSLTEN
jgi:DNA-binding transcriptional LysR family regulator